jgi:uncharacterized protein (DUF4415 family)
MSQKLRTPTDAQDAEINAGIAADPDSPEWTEDRFARARPAREVLPEIFPPEVVAAMLKPRGRPKSETRKVHLNLRVDADVVEEFRATGPGWQSRMNQVLKEWIKAHPPA